MHKLLDSYKSSQSLAISDCRALTAPLALFLRETSCLESQHSELSSLISLLNGLANGLVVFYKHVTCELIVFTLAIIFFKETFPGHSTNIPFAAGCPLGSPRLGAY